MKKTASVSKQPYEVLEEEYRKFVGGKYAVSCSSGTAALHLALLTLNVGPGDEVIIPDFTMAAIAFAVSYTGATPVFCDVDLNTYAIQPDEIEKLITKKTKAIIAVHTYGRLAPMKEIVKLAHGYKIAVIEDACEAQGAVAYSKADITVYSFYKNKIIAAEEGGMIIFQNKLRADRARYLKNMAFSPAHDYFHKDIGYNYRMTNAQAKLALKSLKRYEYNNAQRREIERWYDEEIQKSGNYPSRFIGNILGTVPLYQSEMKTKRDAVWFYETILDQKVVKKDPRIRLPFKPLSSFPMYGGGPGLPNSKVLSESLILLPADPKMGKKDVIKICQKIIKSRK